ncbi:hypothetical protein [Patulibacter minatonensis]|uniref:hypothetical protein n=1 Tax=Patulibacter minatonensis TaxID=298163 RepID=UPI00047D24E9|nr:hypothetical protein [Patulibacter minatonensis]
MRRVALPLPLVLAFAFAAPAGAASSKRCKIQPPDGAGFYGLKVKGVSCATGKRVLIKVRNDQTESLGEYRSRVRVGRLTFTCRTTFPGYEQALDTCKSGSRRVYLRSGA